MRAALGLPITRIGHGVRAIEDPALVEELARRRQLTAEGRETLARTEATVLAAAEDICLVAGTLRDETGAGDAVGIGLIARAH